MHILVIPSWYPTERDDVHGSFFREQAIALSRFGHQIGVVAPLRLPPRNPRAWSKASRRIQQEIDNGVHTYRQTSVEWFGRIRHLGPAHWIRRGLRLFRHYVREHGVPDLVHAHGLLNAGLLAKAISEQWRLPYVVTEHSSAYGRGLVRNWQKRDAAKAARGADKRIAVSEFFAEFLTSYFGEGDAGPWGYVPNIVDADFLTAPFPSHDSKEPQQFTFCNVAFMTEIKAQKDLMLAFAKTFSGMPSMRLVVAGGGPLKKELEDLAISLNIARQVVVLGRLSRAEVLDLVARSDVFVSSSRSETFGVALAEALALGIPVVSTRCGGPESIVHAGDGLLVPAGDVAQLAAALGEIATTAHSYDKVAIRLRCSARFSGDAIAQQLTRIYSEAIQDRVGRTEG